MLTAIERLVTDPGAELVIGIVAPVGANLNTFIGSLQDHLRHYRYASEVIRVSELLRSIRDDDMTPEIGTEYGRLRAHMNAGNELRGRTTNEILALWAMAAISSVREKVEANARRSSTAWIIRSIKHPDEVRALRAVYGPGFFLIGLAVPEEDRRRYLQDKLLTPEQIDDLVARDRAEDFGHGQHTRDAFELSDVFIQHDHDERTASRSIDRFLRLVFGKPVETPTPDEHAMFLAYASSTRSGDLSRQVGAVIWRDGVGVVATGCNDVPRAGGGLYTSGDDDRRDHALGTDANEQEKAAIAKQVAAQVATRLEAWARERGLDAPGIPLEIVEDACRNTRLVDLTEFGRAVHAEMDALLACARAGTSTVGTTLYCTTFPCHNCAKHLVAAGVARVVYVEPYPKSMADVLHGDAIALTDGGSLQADGKVRFEPFLGVGPRRFLDLFSMRLGDGSPLRRKVQGAVAAWSKDRASARVPMLPTSYLERESQVARMVPTLLAEPSP